MNKTVAFAIVALTAAALVVYSRRQSVIATKFVSKPPTELPNKAASMGTSGAPRMSDKDAAAQAILAQGYQSGASSLNT